MSSSTAHQAVSPAGVPSQDAGTATSFAQIDDVMQQPDAFGALRITAEEGAHAAIARHILRRAKQHGRQGWSVGAARFDPWLQVARRLGVETGVEPRPDRVAQDIAHAAAGGVVIVSEGRQTGWGNIVSRELVERTMSEARRLLLVVLSVPATGTGPTKASRRIDNDPWQPRGGAGRGDGRAAAVRLTVELGPLTKEDHRRWWSAVVFEDPFVRDPSFGALESLDGWWQSTRSQPVDTRAALKLGRKAASLRKMLSAAGCALSKEQVSQLAPPAAVEELRAHELVDVDDQGAVYLRELLDATTGALSQTALRELTKALAGPAADGWSCMRAAELIAVADLDEAERYALAAVSCVHDTVAREDLWQRWERVLDRCHETETDADASLGRLVRAAEKALALGDGDRADRMAREAMRLHAGDDGVAPFEVMLLHGRTSHARGDVTTAALSLSRALSVASTPEQRASGAGLMAQVRYMAGDPKQAEKFATEAITSSNDVCTRLGGRNVLGKLLLAKEKWQEAEQHFAADAYEAALAGHREEELRARLNRGIAVLYLGRREQARKMLEEVLNDGEEQGVLTAVAFTLSNLATIAILEHRYERALELSERAISVRRRMGGRIGLVQPITNLAELRLRLGLVDEAEQSLRFGLAACGQGLPLSRYAYFAKLSACIHLERGDTAQAAKELATAISGASCSGDKAQLAQCHRIAARIALEDGDLARARAALTSADALRHTAFGQAELEVIRAAVQRSAGEPFDETSRRALVLAQQADDPESLREAHVLLVAAYRLDDDEESAQSHLRSARQIVNRIAESLPRDLAQRYLRRGVIMDLDHLDDATSTERAAPITVRSGNVTSSQQTSRAPQTRRLVGDSSAMRALRGTIRRVAGMEATVLVTGETGTGKELVAEAIHRASGRSDGPLVKVNCAALVETLLLSELFGHEKGAFTGASSRRRGRFEVAEGGTLFLDEIGDISPRTQVALLRVLQDSTFERVGGCTQLRANVRIVAATHRDLKAMVARGEFREDLYYRLCGVVLEVPALRDRSSDLATLTTVLIDRAHQETGLPSRPVSESALAALSRHPWPGNVRELENAVRVAALFAKGDEIELCDFTDNVEGLRSLADAPSHSGAQNEWGTIPPPALDSAPESLPPSSSTDLVYAEIRSGLKLADMKKKLEHECIARALVESGGNITRAAKLLGMKRPRLSQLVKQYKLATVLEDMKA